MNEFTSKYAIGEHIFFPRSYQHEYHETCVIDGKQWFGPLIETFTPGVSEKKVVGVSFRQIKDGTVIVKYDLVKLGGIEFADVFDEMSFATTHEQGELDEGFKTYEEALVVASQLAANKRTKY